jgi:cytidylate kinase
LDEELAAEGSIGGLLHRLSFGLAAAGAMWGAPPDAVIDEVVYRRETERVIWELAAAGSGVILGRAAAVVLQDEPRALHVRLDGPAARRIAQAMAMDGIDAETAERRLAKTDRAREAYVQRLYRTDARESGLYHLVIDSTVIALDACVELIAAAARARTAASSPADKQE